ncbi:protein memo1 [Anaeramoeba flamelloides]|uniref:Protein memo1 n=1 Tax=Anaeramoeba flamelloides TaxID=1746091 RepID=A0ABQ8YHU5_9EUKA|nr:protein memo1 [Anaeramoeba flamelloides]
MKLRSASHSGSWYSNNPKELKKQLTGLLKEATDCVTNNTPIRALVSPHAGYRHCSKTASYAWKQVAISDQTISRIIILGPSHKYSTKKCLITPFTHLETPFGNLEVDLETNNRLLESDHFVKCKKKIDLKEHSLEMMYPWIAHVVGLQRAKIVPIMVGRLDLETQKECGQVLKQYFQDPNTLFVISSDFCHWGIRFGFIKTYESKKKNNKRLPIWKSIQKIDALAIDTIKTLDFEKYWEYQNKWRTTICGRRAIGILLSASSQEKQQLQFEFLHYSQSKKVLDPKETSVSYAAGVLFEK